MRTLSQIKSDLIKAHYCKDWDAAARLSQEKERVKKSHGRCIDCGRLINRAPRVRCRFCYILFRYYPKSLYEKTLGPIRT